VRRPSLRAAIDRLRRPVRAEVGAVAKAEGKAVDRVADRVVDRAAGKAADRVAAEARRLLPAIRLPRLIVPIGRTGAPTAATTAARSSHG